MAAEFASYEIKKDKNLRLLKTVYDWFHAASGRTSYLLYWVSLHSIPTNTIIIIILHPGHIYMRLVHSSTGLRPS